MQVKGAEGQVKGAEVKVKEVWVLLKGAGSRSVCLFEAGGSFLRG